MFGVLLQVIVKMENTQQALWMIQELRVMKLQSQTIIKTIPTNFNEKRGCKTQGFYILLVFLFITITLLTAVSVQCCLIKYRAKQKHLLAFHEKNIKTILCWC